MVRVTPGTAVVLAGLTVAVAVWAPWYVLAGLVVGAALVVGLEGR